MKVAPFQMEKSNCEFKTKLTWKETFSLYISVHNFIDGTVNCMSEPKTTFLKRNFNIGKLTQTLTWSSGGLCGIPWWQTNEKVSDWIILIAILVRFCAFVLMHNSQRKQSSKVFCLPKEKNKEKGFRTESIGSS